MRRPGLVTRLRYRLAWLGRRADYGLACLLAAAEALAIRLHVRPRYTPPHRYGVFVPARSARHAARRVAKDPRFKPGAKAL